jgi:transposase
MKDDHFVRPKSKGCGIMVSDFITEKDGYLRLTDDEYQCARETAPNIKKEVRLLLEYGENKEGSYFNSEKFIAQMEDAVSIAKVKYPKEDGYNVYWVFDHSSCHTAFAKDALVVTDMNVKPGGGQPKLRDTVYKGKVQRMVFPDGTAKGLKRVLEERGVNTRGMNRQDMKDELASHSDFKDELTIVESFLRSKSHGCFFLPKFHCELNPIKRCWGQAKRYTRAHCNYTIQGLRRIIPKGLDSVTLENIQHFFRKSREYMYDYLEGHVAGQKLEEQMMTYRSHRRIRNN